MTDFDQNGNVVVAEDLDGPRAWAHVMYGLHAISAVSGILTSATIVGAFIFGWPSIVAVIINYVTRDRVRGSWLDSHWRWQLRTFWFAVLWGVLAAILAATVIGLVLAVPAIVVAGVWVLYRVIRGWLALLDRKPLPLPV